MGECIRCGDSSAELFITSTDAGTELVDGRLCKACETDLLWTGMEVGPAGTCGYSDSCNRMAAYATLESEPPADGERKNILCGYHLSILES